jgi:hypothetical protein
MTIVLEALVKEVYRAATGAMTTGMVSHIDSLRGWFVMRRDRNGRHGTNEVWGDGWGWSWFDAANPSVASRNLPMKDGISRPTLDYSANCKGCLAQGLPCTGASDGVDLHRRLSATQALTSGWNSDQPDSHGARYRDPYRSGGGSGRLGFNVCFVSEEP